LPGLGFEHTGVFRPQAVAEAVVAQRASEHESMPLERAEAQLQRAGFDVAPLPGLGFEHTGVFRPQAVAEAVVAQRASEQQPVTRLDPPAVHSTFARPVRRQVALLSHTEPVLGQPLINSPSTGARTRSGDVDQGRGLGLVQRQATAGPLTPIALPGHESSPQPDEPAVQRAETSAATTPGETQAAPGGGPAAATSPEQLEELARRLVGPLTRRLTAQMLLDRERRGHRTDSR
jgi:hypothetical protein